MPYTVQEYIKNAPSVTIVRVLGIGGYQNDVIRLTLSGSTKSVGDRVAAVLKPSRSDVSLALSGPTSASLAAGADWAEATLTVGGTQKTISFNTGSDNFIEKVFGTDPQTTNTNVYVYKSFKDYASSNSFDANVSMSIASGSC